MIDEYKQKIHFLIFLTMLFMLAAYSVLGFAAYVPETVKNVTVMDGNGRKVIQTEAFTFDSILKEARVQMGQHDTYWTSTPKVEDGTMIYVERAVPINIVYQGKTTTLYTTQQTVQGVVGQAGYDLRKVMPLEDGMSKVHQGVTIHINPYTVKRVTVSESVSPAMTLWYDETLSPGQQVIVEPGKKGVKSVTEDQYMVDGKIVHRDVISSEVSDPGTPGTARSGSEDGTVGRILRMKATAYHPSDGGGSGITATGTQAGYGTVAVDPSVIPLGSHVYIPSYGNAVAADTGGSIVGNRIDLCMETLQECYNFGQQYVDVYVSR